MTNFSHLPFTFFTLTNWTILWTLHYRNDDLLIFSLDHIFWSFDLISWSQSYLWPLSLEIILRLSLPWSYLRYVLSLSCWSDAMHEMHTFHSLLITYMHKTCALHCFIGMQRPPAFHIRSNHVHHSHLICDRHAPNTCCCATWLYHTFTLCSTCVRL